MRKVILIATGLLMAASLTACGNGSSTEGGTGGSYEYVRVNTPSGKVDCIIWDGVRAGNITCDWSHR